MPINLPSSIIKAEINDPKFLIYFGKPKAGKSSIAAMLENNLIIDLEKGYRSIDAMKIEVNTFGDLLESIKLIQAANIANNGIPKYKYITIDNGTKLEDILLPYALMLYQKTPMGKKYDGDVRDLPNGAGYRFCRMAIQTIIDSFKCLCDTLILICHTKDSAINQNGKELMEMSIALTGATARIIAADADAIGYMYRSKNKNIINFNGGGDYIVEARQAHLRGQEIVIAESDESGKITTHWDRIFLGKNNAAQAA